MEYRSPVCRARICRKSPLIFQHPSFILARRNNRHHFRVSSRVMPIPPGYTKVFGFAPTWCTTNSLTVSVGLFFVACLEKARPGAPSGARTARAPPLRPAGQKQSSGLFLERGRVPGGIWRGFLMDGGCFLLQFCRIFEIWCIILYPINCNCTLNMLK